MQAPEMVHVKGGYALSLLSFQCAYALSDYFGLS